MEAYILNIGDEVVKGFVINTHARFLALQLESIGFNVIGMSALPDNKEKIFKALNNLPVSVDLVIMTGGLGPTEDDLSKEALALFLKEKLFFNKEENERIKTFFHKRGLSYSSNNERQAYQFADSRYLNNSYGVVKGHFLQRNSRSYLLLPGPPKELEMMFNEQAKPLLLSLLQKKTFNCIKEISLIGITEAHMEEKIEPVIEQYEKEGLHIGTYALEGYVMVRLACYKKELEDASKKAYNKIMSLLSSYIFSTTGESFEKVLIQKLKEKKIRVRLAESFTGGLIANRLVNQQGASQVFDFSLVTYSYESKKEFLGVDPHLLETKGAVNSSVAKQMVLGLDKSVISSYYTLYLSTTGYAPSTLIDKKDSGKAFIAFALVKDGQSLDDSLIEVKEFDLSLYQERNAMRFYGSQKALEILWQISQSV
jgi:nicotinamide-nucleotide amidase